MRGKGGATWRGALAAAAMVAACGRSAAAVEPEEVASAACLKKALTTVDIVDCQTALFEALERKLNAAYRAALASLPEDQRAKLVAAERLWVAFRKSDCDVFYGKETGTAASIEAGSCLTAHTRSRIDDLKAVATP